MDASELTWTGADLLTEFESTLGKKRAFCRMCGTAMYSRRDDSPKVLRVRVGTIDTPITQIPVAHIYAKDLPPWAAIDNDWPQCPELEPGAKR
ncbi:hypothetical protein HDU89_000220 [Geranomyces variabilis]|nr:hypothetical protein HDU89_000220 [Geranomyces variabilis]